MFISTDTKLQPDNIGNGEILSNLQSAISSTEPIKFNKSFILSYQWVRENGFACKIMALIDKDGYILKIGRYEGLEESIYFKKEIDFTKKTIKIPGFQFPLTFDKAGSDIIDNFATQTTMIMASNQCKIKAFDRDKKHSLSSRNNACRA